MKKTLIIIALLIVELGFSQLTVKKSTIDSGGTITHNGNTTMLYTVGELAVLENVNATISISGISVYPNPTINYVNLNFEHQDIYNISIFDINGKQLVSKTVNTNNYQLDFTHYAQSVYLVVVKNKSNKTYRTFKIIKN